MSDQINFKKKATPQHISCNQSSLITYTISNLTAFSIISVTIYDPLIKIPNILISPHSNCELNFTDSTIQVKLPEGGLKKNQNATCSIQLYSTNTTPPSNTLYSTTATVTAIIPTTPYTTLTENAVSNLILNYAYLTVSNSISPSDQAAPGETVVYTIELKNSGNQTATIRPGEFLNYWHPYRLTNIIVSDNRLLAKETEITNTSILRIPKDQSIIFTINATIV